MTEPDKSNTDAALSSALIKLSHLKIKGEIKTDQIYYKFSQFL